MTDRQKTQRVAQAIEHEVMGDDLQAARRYARALDAYLRNVDDLLRRATGGPTNGGYVARRTIGEVAQSINASLAWLGMCPDGAAPLALNELAVLAKVDP